MFLGIEIGGTKLQLAVGAGDGSPLVELERVAAEPRGGAERIREQLVEAGKRLLARHAVTAIGIGFGGPVDTAAGQTVTSHQVAGWDRFPVVDWCQETFGLPAVLSNDSDAAGLAEARFGGGRARRIVFYTNIGSGIGGALVIDGQVYGGAGGVASELGHLRPCPDAERPDQTVESLASGWGIARAVRQRLAGRQGTGDPDADDLLRRCDGRIEELDTKAIALAAQDGNGIAVGAIHGACRVYGWAIAQMATLLAPEVVVVGGGVSLVGEDLFFGPLRDYVNRYVFPPLKETFQIVPALLGEEVVLHGALALAARGSDLQSDLLPTPNSRGSDYKSDLHPTPNSPLPTSDSRLPARIQITYCTGCRWMLRAAWMAQELLSTFEKELGEVALVPGAGGVFDIRLGDELIWSRRQQGGLPEIKHLKQLVRDRVAPGRGLGHMDP